MEDALKRGKHYNCIKALTYQGFSEEEAKLACAKFLVDNDAEKSAEWDLNLDFVDADEEIEDNRLKGESGEECVKRKIHIFAHEHPDWSHDQVVAASHGYCGLSKSDAIELSHILKRSTSLSLSKFSTLIKNIKSRIGLKVPHMGILPQKTSLPMKNLNRLQTKLEKTITQEQKWLTAEQYEQRKQYAKYMRKSDAEEEIQDEELMSDEEFTDSINILYNEILNYFPFDDAETAIDKAFELPIGDNAWILSNEAQIISMNDGLNNIIKAPIILAKEMVQPYTTEKGEVEYHFKPYNELEKAVERLGKNGSLDMIIEHQDWYDTDNIIGYVKEIRADNKERCIRGMGYFHESKLPKGLKQMIKDGEIVPVSIGFLAKLGNSGTWQGIEYKHTQEHMILRHLAICLDSIARCPAGMCGVNLKDANSEKTKTFIIIKKDNYYYNICNIIRDSKKETNTESIIKKIEKVEKMQEDSNRPQGLPSDIDAILSKLISLIQDQKVETEPIMKKILTALGIKNKSDNKMDEKEFKDTLDKKDLELKDLIEKLENAKKLNDSLASELRENYIAKIKKFGDKFSDEELEAKNLNSLKEIADAVSRFAPSEDKPEVIPVAGKDDKKKMEDEIGKEERIDFSKVFDDVRSEFNMQGL